MHEIQKLNLQVSMMTHVTEQEAQIIYALTVLYAYTSSQTILKILDKISLVNSRNRQQV